ncbi:MAG: class I SAM-dependent methyltransferase [Patescibacteria group bacterium]
MNHEGQQFYYNQGKTYWWIRSKYDVVLSLIERFCAENIRARATSFTILDVGCGPGNILDWLKEYGRVIGNDTSEEARDFVKQRGMETVDGDIAGKGIPLPDGSCALITMIDALEHMEDDRRALVEVKRLLRDKGQVVITVPAYMALWGAHDVKYGHYRRYVRSELVKKLQEAGFLVEKATYIQPLFLPVMYVFRAFKRWRKQETDDFVSVPPWLNGMLLRVLASERHWLRFLSFPFGPTMIVIARKP